MTGKTVDHVVAEADVVAVVVEAAVVDAVKVVAAEADGVDVVDVVKVGVAAEVEVVTVAATEEEVEPRRRCSTLTISQASKFGTGTCRNRLVLSKQQKQTNNITLCQLNYQPQIIEGEKILRGKREY